jgi:multisubunit Na+/H+ antiporter MnhB subunit
VTPASWTLLDLALAAAVLLLAGGALHSRNLRHAVILFIVFGLVLALIWARLRAPDVALAEAAIGAGLAGALLLAALRDAAAVAAKPERPPHLLANLAVSLLVALLAVAMAWALLHGLETGDPVRLAGEVAANLAQSGVSNPVTAVLLNFRAYDTLLELAVLLAALLGVLSLGPARPPYRPAGPVFGGLVAWLVPLLILTAGYQLWVGAHAPGGAFQAGALLAAAGVVLHLAGRERAGLPGGLMLRAVAVAGIGMFVAVGLGTLWFGTAFLAYPSDWAGALILLIESLATLAIAATLVLVYLGGTPEQWHADATEERAP